MVLPFFFLLCWIQLVADREEAKNLTGNVLRLIEIRLATPSLARIPPACQEKFAAIPNRRFEFQKRDQYFMRVHSITWIKFSCERQRIN
jgi:hypothetical protein